MYMYLLSSYSVQRAQSVCNPSSPISRGSDGRRDPRGGCSSQDSLSSSAKTQVLLREDLKINTIRNKRHSSKRVR